MPGSLVIAGLGIQVPRQVTWEARAEIERAERLLYLVADPVAEAWLQRSNPAAESLADCYLEGRSRAIAYERMVERMLAPVRTGARVCAAFYGHPGVFVSPTHEAIRIARAEHFEARMLPGISAEDCLFADLGVDPARSGCQSYEATDFLVNERTVDPRSALILWQAGLVGRVEYRHDGFGENRLGLSVLQEALLARYSPDHEVVIYEASPYSVIEPSIRRTCLRDLLASELEATSTLLLPPLPSRANEPMLRRLGIDVASLQGASAGEGDSRSASSGPPPSVGASRPAGERALI